MTFMFDGIFWTFSMLFETKLDFQRQFELQLNVFIACYHFYRLSIDNNIGSKQKWERIMWFDDIELDEVKCESKRFKIYS